MNIPPPATPSGGQANLENRPVAETQRTVGSANERQAPPPLRCPACDGDILISELQSAAMNSCPTCEKALTVRLYPALTRKETVNAGRRILLEEESACFFHESKQAESLCEDCGRYLCGLCEIVFEGKTLCPACLETAQEKETMDGLVRERFRHDSFALMLALLPILFWPITIITVPAAIIYAIFRWNSAGSLVRSGNGVFAAAILLGLAQIGFWLWIFFAVSFEDFYL